MFSNNVVVSSNLQQVKQLNLLLKEPVHFWLAHYTNDYDVNRRHKHEYCFRTDSSPESTEH